MKNRIKGFSQFVNENQQMQQQQQMITQKAAGCFNSKAYPEIAKLMGDHKLDAWDIGDYFLRIVNPPYAAFRFLMGTSAAYEAVKKAYNNSDKLQAEVTKFLGCINPL